MKWLKQNFKNIDLISENVSLYHNGSTKFKNSVGAYLSLLVLLIGFSAIINFVIETTSRKKPEISTSEEYMIDPKFFLNETNLFAFAVMKENAAVIEDQKKKFDVYMTYTVSNGSNKEHPVVDTRIELISCADSSRFKRLSKSMQNKGEDLLYNPLSNYFCLPDELPDPIRFTWGDPFFATYKIFVVLKQINPEILDEMKLIYLHILSSDNYFDGNLINNPVNSIINSQLIVSGVNLYKDLNLYYKKVDFITDYGYVFEEAIKEESYYLERLALDTNLRTSDNILFYMKLTVQKVKEIKYRRYTKLQTTLANVGGIIKFLFTVAQIVGMAFAFKVYENIINPLIKTKSMKMQKLIRNVQENFKIINENTYNNFFKIDDRTIISKASLDNSKPEMMTNQKIKKKSNESILSKIFCISKSINTIKFTLRKLLSVKKLIKIGQDIKILKNILLNENQQLVFKLMNYEQTNTLTVEKLNVALDALKIEDNSISRKMIEKLKKSI
jgi:hypothetical protein